jgi:hypothetical protein
MNRRRRTRVLAGLLGLIALGLSFSEAVLASVCAPMDGMQDMATGMPEMAADMAAQTSPATEPGATDGLLMAGHDEGPEGGDHCPLSPAVGPGCSAVASLPASDAQAPPLTGQGTWTASFDDVRPDLLLTHALFRPPRA